MKDVENTWHRQRTIADIVDLLIGACALYTAYATFNAAADLLDLVVAGVIALIGIGFLLETNDEHPAQPMVG
jgi:hypothetical protein